MDTISLSTMACPSCGGQLEGITGKHEVTCDYCSTSVKIIQPKAIDVDNYKKSFKAADLEKFINISSIIESSMKAGNYPEAYDYCNKALELNPKIGEVWENKAICSFWNSVSFIGRDEIVYSKAREIVTLLNSSKEHDTDSKTYEAASDGIGFNLGQITMAKIAPMIPDTKENKVLVWSNILQSRLTDYLNTIEVSFQIMSNKDTALLKYIIAEYSGGKKRIWLIKDKKTDKYEPQNIFKKREMLIKKVKEIEPDYVPPKIIEPAKVPWYVKLIIVLVGIGAYALTAASNQ